LLEYLRNEFDLVLIDSPPALHLPDARIMAQLADAVVLITRARRTTRDEALVVKERLMEDGAQILGTVLNDWNPRLDSVGYRYQTYEKHKAYSDKNNESSDDKAKDVGRAAISGH
jgi:Mrp family chromosome partitioning ATPase